MGEKIGTRNRNLGKMARSRNTAQDYIGRLKELDILTLEERKHQADMHMLHKIMKGYGGLRSETSFESAANNALHVMQSATNAHNIRVKETVSRDFLTLVFSSKNFS